MSTVWITGASSGLGLYTMEALLSLGWQVAAGARSFAEKREGDALYLPLDVTQEDSVAAFAQKAVDAFGVPDALINAAGMLILGPAEDVSLEEYQRVMEVNFLGAVRMVKAALPLMRGQGAGKIVNFSSVNGLLATPFEGPYVASKHALEGWSEALKMECAPHGIQVMVVEPGDHQGGQSKYRPHAHRVSGTYRPSFDRVTATIAKDEATGSDPRRLGRKVAKALSKKRLPMRLKVVKLPEGMALILHDILPSNLFLKLLSLYYRV